MSWGGRMRSGSEGGTIAVTSSAAAVAATARFEFGLGALLRGSADTPTLDQELVGRQESLGRRRRRRRADGDGADDSDSAVPILTWHRFSRGASPASLASVAGHQARRTFGELSKSVADALGGVAPAEDVANAVGALFLVVESTTEESVLEDAVCDALGLGSCSKEQLEDWKQNVSDLSAWHADHVGSGGALGRGGSGSLRRATSDVERGSFGARFRLLPWDDELVDVPPWLTLVRGRQDGRRSSERREERDGEDTKEEEVGIVSAFPTGTLEWLLECCSQLSSGLGAAGVAKGVLQAVRETSARGTGRESQADASAALQSRLVDLLGMDEKALHLLSIISSPHTQSRLRASAAVPDLDAALRAAAGALSGASTMGGGKVGGVGGVDRSGLGTKIGRKSGGGGGGAAGGVGVHVDMGGERKLTKRELRRLKKQQAREAKLYGRGGAGRPLEHAKPVHSQGGGGATGYDASDPYGLNALGLGHLGVGTGGAVGVEAKVSLPVGTKDTNYKTHREYVVPAPPQAAAVTSELDLIPIAALPERVQPAFAGTERLNPLQSAVYEAALFAAENLLICAPTGAGKTNVAMLSVCREILIRAATHPDAKIVYVAPMKALAAEVAGTFGRRLAPLGMKVRELTGDMQLTRREIAETHMIVTTPEKWDVVTRKATESGSGSLVRQVVLLIIDEVHLLESDRGAVLEAIVARTLRHTEAAEAAADATGAPLDEQVRLVGLSATLPNFRDVAMFLRVNPSSGLFHFSGAHRPVPLEQTFIGLNPRLPLLGPDGKSVDREDDEGGGGGVGGEGLDGAAGGGGAGSGDGDGRVKKKALSSAPHVRLAWMNSIAYNKCVSVLSEGKQAMIFVHSRRDTAKTARALMDFARSRREDGLFRPDPDDPMADSFRRDIQRSKNGELKELIQFGFGMHHAGMLRCDRSLVERMFLEGQIRVLVCTATLAWGVNLPAHLVIIKGTQVYNAEAGGFVELSMLDVTQIFGRAGRPQFDTFGRGCIITTHDALPRFLRLLTHQTPIESSFIKQLPDHLNAEIVSGTVSNLREAVRWLSYTYLYIRMLRNPLAYGVSLEEKAGDPMLEGRRISLAHAAATRLDECRMIRYEERTGQLHVTDLGRTASHFYIQHDSVDVFYRAMEAKTLDDAQLLGLLCKASEFTQVRVRDEELPELDSLRRFAPLRIKEDVASTEGKVNLLLQTLISRAPLRSFTLISDASYVYQSAGRLARGLFEIALRKGWSTMAASLLRIAQAIDKRVWWFESPLRQFREVQPDLLDRIQQVFLLTSGAGTRRQTATAAAAALEAGGAAAGFGSSATDASRGVRSLNALLEATDDAELGAALRRSTAVGKRVRIIARSIPRLDVKASAQPITHGILRINLTCTPDFDWVDRVHGRSRSAAEPFWVWIEDSSSHRLHHFELVLINRQDAKRHTPTEIVCTVPVPEPLPPQYWVRAVSDRWLGGETLTELSFRHLLLPDKHMPHTDLLDLVPLPLTALRDPAIESLYKFTHFNPVQTQFFHVVYETDHNVLLGAPTGSGKTFAAELGVYHVWKALPRGSKTVYVAPLKALVRERLRDWRAKFAPLGRKVVELTGDSSPDARALREADVIVTTPEKWDGVTRGWRHRPFVTQVGLLIMDEVHLLGEDRGPVLEAIVSRTRFISAQLRRPTRVIALSTALANAPDLADWLGIDKVGLFNFRPSVRPCPMEVHIAGFSGRHYCPRMALMNKPTYAAIQTHSPSRPALVFVSSRRQTRLTAQELVALAAADETPGVFLHMPLSEAREHAEAVRDETLRSTLLFGVGMHHAGLAESDRAIVEKLFLENKIQVLVCTATLAWGVNLPARLVVIKGTEFFDGKTGRYVDFPITDVLQMMGRAGRPQFDDKGVAMILVHEPKRNFYKKFLYEPFPVESQLRKVLHDHLCAEIAGGAVSSRRDAVDYLSWTFFFRRLIRNPAYYGLEDSSPEGISAFLLDLVDSVLDDLEAGGCILRGERAWDELAEEIGLGAARARDLLHDHETRAARVAMPKLGKHGVYVDGEGDGEGDGGGEGGGEGKKEEEEKLMRELPAKRGDAVVATALGQIGSFYYVSYKTMGDLGKRLGWVGTPGRIGRRRSAARCPLHAELCRLLSQAHEFAELPVRHNEEELNADLARVVPWEVDSATLGDPHTKAFLLLQAHMARVKLPIIDYANDTRSVLDQAPRVMGAMMDVAADAGRLGIVVALAELQQCLIQARFPWESTLRQLPHVAVSEELERALQRAARVAVPRAPGSPGLAELLELRGLPAIPATVNRSWSADVRRTLSSIPRLSVRWSVGESASTLPSPTPTPSSPSPQPPITLPLSAQVCVELHVDNAREAKRSVFCPRWPKAKRYGAWIVIGIEGDGVSATRAEADGVETFASLSEPGEVLALKRLELPIGRRNTTTETLNIDFSTLKPTRSPQTLHLFVILDSLAGTDHQYSRQITLSPE